MDWSDVMERVLKQSYLCVYCTLALKWYDEMELSPFPSRPSFSYSALPIQNMQDQLTESSTLRSRGPSKIVLSCFLAVAQSADVNRTKKIPWYTHFARKCGRRRVTTASSVLIKFSIICLKLVIKLILLVPCKRQIFNQRSVFCH